MARNERQILVDIINKNLVSTESVAEMLGVTRSRLNKLKELKAVVRGFYLKIDVENYLNNEEIQNRVNKYRRNKHA